MCLRGVVLVEYFGKQTNRLFGFQALVCETPIVAVFLCWSLLNPDLFLSSLSQEMCYFNTSGSH